MRVRTYTRSDVSDIATIHAWCNKTDVIARYIYSKADQYPTSYRIGNWRFIRSTTLQPGTTTIVVETEPSDYPPSESHKAPEVVGYAKYERLGKSEQARKWQSPNDQWWAKIERTLIGLEDRYYQAFPRVQQAWERARFQQIFSTLRTPFDDSVFPEALELALCFVRPDWQRRGIGKKLMQWGFEQAQKEKIPMLVKSSPVGAAAYRACGFKSIKTINFSQWFDEREFGGELCQMWVWEPTLTPEDNVEGGWYQRAMEKERLIAEEIRIEKEQSVTT